MTNKQPVINWKTCEEQSKESADGSVAHTLFSFHMQYELVGFVSLDLVMRTEYTHTHSLSLIPFALPFFLSLTLRLSSSAAQPECRAHSLFPQLSLHIHSE